MTEEEFTESIEDTLARLAAEVPAEEWDNVNKNPEVEALKKQLALTEKALGLACARVSGCPKKAEYPCDTSCNDCQRQHFIDKAKEQQ